ncbi:MAG: hypothetical protein IJW92_02610 [Clostridia bacterium]|nr:hypothetical protein [Clostridia bacterium]
MNVKNNSKNTMTTALIYTVLGILVGILLIAISTDFLLKVVFVIMGIVTVACNLPGLIQGISENATPAGKTQLVLSALSVALGFVMIFWHNSVLMILLGVYMLILPIVRILQAADRSAQIKTELPRLILGAVLILLGPAGVLDILFDIAGWCTIALSVVYLITVYVSLRKHQNTPGARVFVDTDGNGKIDTVYVDTTGDGKADTATNYKEDQ